MLFYKQSLPNIVFDHKLRLFFRLGKFSKSFAGAMIKYCSNLENRRKGILLVKNKVGEESLEDFHNHEITFVIFIIILG